MINQEFKAQGTKYHVLPNFGICCRELGGGSNYEFWCMRTQFLLRPSEHNCQILNVLDLKGELTKYSFLAVHKTLDVCCRSDSRYQLWFHQSNHHHSSYPSQILVLLACCQTATMIQIQIPYEREDLLVIYQ